MAALVCSSLIIKAKLPPAVAKVNFCFVVVTDGCNPFSVLKTRKEKTNGCEDDVYNLQRRSD